MHASKRRLTLAGAALALTIISATAHAQAIFGAVEVDDDETQLYLLGGALSFGGLGWKPFGTLVGYHLRFDAGTDTRSRNVVVPTLGLAYETTTQQIGFGVGYAFTDEEGDEQPLLVGGQSGEGVVASVGWDYWGDGNRQLQFLGSYNFGVEYLWTRARAAWRLTPTSPLFVGGEAGILGGGDDDGDSPYLAQFGPLVEWRFNPQFRLNLSGGLKVGIAEVEGSAAYGRLEFLWLPTAR